MNTPHSLIGSLIDQFRLDQFIAKGAMGLVFKAFDTVLVRTVALKLISKRLEEDLTEEELTVREEARKRLIQEAKAAGRLNHPNILTIFSYGETEDFEYICMEYVTGRTLAQVLQERKTIEPAEAIEIGEQILLALDAANREHIVHRDIKPSNIMITEDGRLKVMDFGIAKLPSFSMTTTGTVLGTPYYMSPEQISGQKVDIRSDIFSTGAVLYQILTGERPFEATNTATLAYKIVQVEPVPPDVLNVNIPHPLGYVIKKALAKNPMDRYQTPAEMLAALRALRQEEYCRNLAEAGVTVSVPRPDAELTVQVQRPEKPPHEPPPPPREELTVQAGEPGAPAPEIRPEPPPSDAGKEARKDDTGGEKPPSVTRPPEPDPTVGSSDGRTGSEPTKPEGPAPRPVASTEALPSARASKKTGTPTAGKTVRGKDAPPPRGSGGRYAAIAIVCLAVLGGGFLLNSYWKGKPSSSDTDQRPAHQAPPTADSAESSKPSPRTAVPPSPGRPTVESLLLQAKSRQWESDPLEAQKLLEEAVSIDPNHFEANFQLARVLTHRQEYQRAIQVYKHTLALNDRAPEIYFNLGYIYLNQGAYDEAIQNYEACWALNPPYQDEVLTNLGIAYLKKNQADRAQQLFQQALTLNPSNVVARSYIRGISGSSAPPQTQPSESTPSEPTASAERPAAQGGARVKQMVEEATGLMQTNAAKAERLLRDALNLDGESFEANFQLGRLFTFQKKYDLAILHYQKALNTNHQSADAHFNLGFIYMTQKDYDRAIESYEACLGLKPPYTDEVLTNLGISYLRKNAPTQARTLFLEALDWNPKNEIARNYLNQLDRTTEAKAGTATTQEPKLEGNYRVAGINPGGSRYEGTASIRKTGDRYDVAWWIGSDAFTGTGTLEGDTFTVNWKGSGGSEGRIVYTVSANGVLKGVWGGGSGSETLTPTR